MVTATAETGASHGRDHRRAQRTGPAAVAAWLDILSCAAVIGVAIAMLLGEAGRFVVQLDLFTHFQPQYLAAAMVGTVLLLTRRRWGWGSLGLAVAIIAAARVVPWYLPGEATAPNATANLRVATINLNWANRAAAAVRDAVHAIDADIIAFQECTPRWLDDLQPLAAEYPYRVVQPREDAFGIAMFSRLPLRDAQVQTFGQVGVPSLSAAVRLADRRVHILATHPVPPLPAVNERRRNDQLRAVGAYLGDLPRDEPVVLLGDLNNTMWSPTFALLTVHRRMHNARRGFGLLPTWNLRHPFVLHIPIDHCLVSERVRIARCDVGPDIGSDHLPLIADLVIPPSTARE